MLLVNYQTKIWTKIIHNNKSRARWTENNKDKKNEGIDNTDIKKLSGQFYLPPSITLHH